VLEKQDNHWVILRSGQSHFQLVGMAADEFPALPTYSQIQTFEVPAKDLMQLIERAIFCVSTDDNRHNLSGVFCVSPGPKTLRMVATDGHRLALTEKTFANEVKIPQGVIVPRKGFQELRRVLGDSDAPEQVELGFSATNGLLKAGSVVLSTRLVEGQFPEYDQVIPKESDKKVRIARGAFAEALRRVSLLSQNRAHGVRLKLTAGHLELVAEDPELGTARETIDVEYKGPDLTIGFNARYILDVLGHMHDEGIVFELSDDLSPGVLKPLEEPGFLAVVMPMRI
jgi:DNA polymerase-3 subunit beta